VDTVESLVVARALTTSNQRIDYETETLIAHSLRADGFDASEDGTGRGTPLVPVAYAIGSHAGAADGDQTNRSHAKGGPVGLNISEEVGYAVRAGRPPAVAFDARQSDVIQYGDKTGPLDTDGQTIGVLTSGVRRLTPRECERLQGLPDDYTLITYRGKPAADGPRYKAIGNSMAVPVVRWILSRLAFMDAFQRQQERQTA
jgi:DNA (cytosine-5)-methyltransferase 1